jgi:hypothetical protein
VNLIDWNSLKIDAEAGRGIFKQLVEWSNKEHGRNNDYMAKILSADDWAFAIKAHALVESAINRVLIEAIGEAWFRLIFSDHLSVGRAVRIAQRAGIVKKDQAEFVQFFSAKLRNPIVHDPKNIDFSFAVHIAQMSQSEKEKWVQHVTFFTAEEDTPKDEDGNARDWKSLAVSQPKAVLAMAVVSFVAHCQDQNFNERLKKRFQRHVLEQACDDDDTYIG